MAAPTFCTVKEAMRKLRELLRDVRPRTSHGRRERIVAITKYGFRFFRLIGMQSDRILQEQDDDFSKQTDNNRHNKD